MKITLKSQRGSDLFTLETEDRSVQFDDFCLDVGPWGYAMLVLLRHSETTAIIGVVPDRTESGAAQVLPTGWIARTASRWGLVSDTPIIGNAPLVYIVFSLLAEAGCFDQPSARTSDSLAPMAPWPNVSATGLRVIPGGTPPGTAGEEVYLQAEIRPGTDESTTGGSDQ